MLSHRKPPSPSVNFDPSHYAHLTHTSPTDLTKIQSSSPLPVHGDTVIFPLSAKVAPTPIAPPTSVAPSTSKATPSQVSPPQGDIRIRPSPVPGDASEPEVRDSGTSLLEERKEGFPDTAPSLPPVDDEPVWVNFDLTTSSALPVAPAPMEGFDLYIDGVRFLPDNATIVKVTITGGFAAIEEQNRPLDLCALPDLTSMGRCPKFTYRARNDRARPDQIVELRVWTVDRYTHQLVVLGVCLLKVYNERTKKMNIGGHQFRLRSGYPTPHQPLLPQSLDHLPPVPGCSILLRLLPHSEKFIEVLPYSSGFYQSDACKPNESEIKVIEHYKAKQDWSKRVKETALDLARSEDDNFDIEHDPEIASNQEENKMAYPWSKMSDGDIAVWMTKRLEEKHQPSENLPPLLEIDRCVDYERQSGVAIKIRRAFGLQAEKCYSIVLTRLLPGPTASQQTSESEDGRSSRFESFLTKEMDLDSHMKAPRWKDNAAILRPVYDEQSVLLLQFFGLEVVYKIDPSGRTKGVVQAPKGKGHLSLDSSSYQGWGVLPIFDRNCVIQGTFIIPVFQNNQNKPFLKGLMDAPSLESWMRVSVEKKLFEVHPSHPSAIVSIWDGHFYQGQNVPLPRRDYLLHLAGDFNKFSGASQDKTGHPLNQIVLRSLPSSVQSEGTSGREYLKEKQNFEESMHSIATELVEDALLTTGQAPLTSAS